MKPKKPKPVYSSSSLKGSLHQSKPKRTKQINRQHGRFKKNSFYQKSLPQQDNQPEQGSFYVYGKNSILELLREHPKRIHKIYLDRELKGDRRLQQIQHVGYDNRISIQEVPKQKIQSLIYTLPEPHARITYQGVVALVTQAELWDLSLWLNSIQPHLDQNPGGLVFLLDGITDPHNIGSIIRVAEGMGALGVLLPRHKSGALSPVVSKTSSGADAIIPLVQVGNVNVTLDRLKQAGFWILGSDCSPHTPPFYQIDYRDLPTVVVLGSEGRGLRAQVRQACDMLGTIPMRGKIQSLNVATAAAIMAYEIVTQQHER